MTARRLVAAVAAAALVFALGGAASASSVSVLHSFGGADGVSAAGQLVDGGDGFLYGATRFGGTVDPTENPDGYGTLFRVDAAGNLTTIYRFNRTDGEMPNGLVRGPDGFFYGTTSHGGDPDELFGGVGTLFRVDSAGNLTVLHRFVPVEGSWPSAAPTFGPDGALYGSSSAGSGASYYGTLWRWTPESGLAVIHRFTGWDGFEPLGPLRLASDGNLYGTTNDGGAFRSCGTVFRIVPPGAHELLHSFAFTDGCQPKGGVVEATDGAFYGTTETGLSWGTVFRMDGAGNVTTLHSFDAYLTTGAFPASGLFQASDGFLYGTASRGGSSPDPVPPTCNNMRGGEIETVYCGVVFRVSTTGDFALVHTFTGGDGNMPMSGVMQWTDGALYGGTAFGGAFGRGVLYRLGETSGTILPTLTSLTLSQPSATAGSTITGTVRLGSAALAGGAEVALASSLPRIAAVPSAVMVPAGATTATFAIATKRKKDGLAVISASYHGITRTAVLIVVR